MEITSGFAKAMAGRRASLMMDLILIGVIGLDQGAERSQEDLDDSG